jgi:group II intron reverse transcriptase/maturase
MPNKAESQGKQMAMEKSDRPIVPTKPGNAGGGMGATPTTRSTTTPATPSGGTPVSRRLDRITARVRQHPSERLTNLMHHLDVELLHEAFSELEERRAPGIDGVTKVQYGANLQTSLPRVVEDLHRRRYRPQAARRHMIPKANGKQRPLGIPTIEDKVVQRALVKVLNPVYEEEFYDFSFGFRPGRGCHDALKRLSKHIHQDRTSWIVEADIKGFFDHVNHGELLRMLAHRIADPGILWLVERFLKSGVNDGGVFVDVDAGTPQGGVISPLLANVYLHYVLDDWFARAVAPQCRGQAHLVRYADDFVATFEYEEDARRFYADLPRRLGKYGLLLASEKTRLFRFGRFARAQAEARGEYVEKFDFLGFQFRCGRTRRGRFKVKWSTAPEKFRAKVRDFSVWLKAQATTRLSTLWPTVNAKLRGHYAYYNVNDNWRNLLRFRGVVLWQLFHWSNRRSQRRSFTMSSWLTYVDRHILAKPKPGTMVKLNANVF